MFMQCVRSKMSNHACVVCLFPATCVWLLCVYVFHLLLYISLLCTVATSARKQVNVMFMFVPVEV